MLPELNPHDRSPRWLLARIVCAVAMIWCGVVSKCLGGEPADFRAVFSEQPRAVSPPNRPTSMSLRLVVNSGAKLEAAQQHEATVFTAEAVHGDGWCPSCTALKARWGEGSDRVRIVYSRDRAPGEATYPAVRWQNEKGVWQRPVDRSNRVVVPATLDELADWIDSTNPPRLEQPDSAAASGDTAAVGSRRGRLDKTAPSAGTIHGKAMIAAALNRWQTHIGEGVPVTGVWHRNGIQTVTLLGAGRRWGAADIYGTSGSFEIHAAGAKLPIQTGEISYRIADGKIRLRGETEIDADALNIGTVRPAMSAAEPVGVSPLMILSGLSMLWQLLHPEADIQLGGTISATAVLNGDVLTVTFDQMPSLRFKMLFTFQLAVKSVEIRSERVKLNFTGSRWITSREFAVEE